jgi:hypothetical protein
MTRLGATLVAVLRLWTGFDRRGELSCHQRAGWRSRASRASHPLPSNPSTHLGEMLSLHEGEFARPPASGAGRPFLLVSSARHRVDYLTTADEPERDWHSRIEYGAGIPTWG